ncbi:tRNA (guanine-N(7)-)-methyltransferase (tRNA(m7G46)-methyltransferase), partial [Spiromyces aspiralis]
MAKPAPRSTNAGCAPHSDIGETVATAAATAAAATAVTTVEAISARNGDGSIGVGVVGVRRDPSAYLPHTSRQSVYYQQRDNPATISPPLFSLHEILTNVSALSAFAEYMDLVGRRFSLEYWLNIEGLRKMPNDAPTVISPQTINTLWKSYFTLRVDELGASEDTLSAVQKYLKPYRTSGKLDLNLENVDNETLSVAFDLMCRVQADLFSQIEQREYPNFLRSTLYRRFLTSYVLTPYQTQIKNQIFPATTPVHGVDTANDAHSIAESSDSVANPFIAPLSLRSPSSVKNIPIVHYPGPLSQTALSFGDKGDASNASTMMPDPLHRLNSIPEDGGGGDADGDKGKGVGLVKANGDSTIAQPDAGNSGYSYATNLWLELTSSLFGTNGPKGSEGKITGDLDREKQSAGTATGGMGS